MNLSFRDVSDYVYGIGIAIVLLLIGGFWTHALRADTKELHSTLDKEINAIETATPVLGQDLLLMQTAQFEDMDARAHDLIAAQTNSLMDLPEPIEPIACKDKIHQVLAEIQTQRKHAGSAELTIHGFSTELPAADLVPLVLRRLAWIEWLAHEHRDCCLQTLQFPKSPSRQIESVTLTVTGTPAGIVQFLYACQTDEHYFQFSAMSAKATLRTQEEWELTCTLRADAPLVAEPSDEQ